MDFERSPMPPSWLPLTALLAIIAVSALRVLSVERKHGVKAFSFGRHAAIQSLAERNWKFATGLTLAAAVTAWLAPGLELVFGRPPLADLAALKWMSAFIFVASFLIIAIAQLQMGASWRIGVPAEGPGPLVAHGLFRLVAQSDLRRHGWRGAGHVLVVAAPHYRGGARRHLDAHTGASAH